MGSKLYATVEELAIRVRVKTVPVNLRRLPLLIKGDPIVPITSREKVVRRHPNGTKAEAFYFIGRTRVGVREWWNDGTLAYEWAIKKDLINGRWVSFDTCGVPELEGTYLDGQRHGIRVQFDRRGKVIGTCEFKENSGVDLYFDWYRLGSLSSECPYRNDQAHGIERFWLSRSVLLAENYWFNYRRHGIWRSWNKQRLRRGYPEYWINDIQVTRQQYLKACQADETLPTYRKN